MIDAKVLATLSQIQDPDYYEVWGVWMPRRGDNVIFVLEVVSNHFANIRAELFQKNYDETGNGTTTSQSLVFEESTGRASLTKTGAKELVRFKLTIERGRHLPVNDLGLVLFRFLQPVWFESVKP